MDKPHINMRHIAYSYAIVKRSFSTQYEDHNRFVNNVKR
jgi:hypothetical protein